MIEKNKTYTYEEIEKNYRIASAKAIEKFNNDFKKIQEKNNKEDSSALLAFFMQNMMFSTEIASILFEKENEVNEDE